MPPPHSLSHEKERRRDMAHMVFKKPLQNQTTRENYIKQRQELRHARETGLIDVQAYKDAKKDLLSDRAASFDPIPISPSMISFVDSGSVMSSCPTHPEIRKGSIIDRNNVARLVYKPDAQGQQDRGEYKAIRKAQKAQAQAERFPGKNYNISPSSQLTPEPYAIHRTTTLDSSKSEKSGQQRMNFNIFRKLSGSNSRSPPLLGAPPVPPLSRAREKPSRSDASDTSSTAKSSVIRSRRNTESHGGGGSAYLDVPMNFADAFLFGSSPPGKSRTSSRRHSFSSQHTRLSFTSSRAETTATGNSHEGFVFESRPSSEISQQFHEPVSPRDQPQQPLLSTVTQDLFLSLLDDFSNNSVLFSYPKYGRVQYDSPQNSFRSISRSTGIDEVDEEIGKAIGGGLSFLVDESIVTLKAILERRIWFLMAMKWLSFGRVLFSPGHYIIQLSGDVGIGAGEPGAAILDLDGAITG